MRELTFCEYVEGYMFDSYEKWSSVIRQQYATSAAISSSLFGKPRLTLNTLFGKDPTLPGIEKTFGLVPLQDFPNDIEPLPKESVLKLMEFSKERKLDLWNEHRGKAAINEEDRLLSRAAQDDYLWGKWMYAMSTSGRPSQESVLQWAQNAVNEQTLNAPAYFIDVCKRKGIDPNSEWNKQLGESRLHIQNQLFEGMLNA